MGVVRYTIDTLRSFVSRLGDPTRDKAASVFYDIPQWTEQDLFNAYRGSWIARKIVRIPASDATRKWRNWQADQDQITKIEDEEKRLGLRRKVLHALIRARLTGGAALYFGVESQGDPSQPLELDTVRRQGLSFVTILGKRDLAPGDIEKDPASEWYGKPAWYMLDQTRIHPSRLVLFYGAELPDDDLFGVTERWGDSVLVSTLRTIQQTDATAANIASLVFEAKVDVIRIEDLMQNLADPQYEERLLKRFSLANAAKGINAALLLDKSEEYEQKSASFDTLPDVLDRFLQMVSGAADIPMTRFLGRSPGGLNSTGDSDLNNYYDHIETIQTTEMQPAMMRLDEVLIRSALGLRPPEIHFVWAPLKQKTEKEITEIGEKQAIIVDKLNNTGLFPQEALAKAAINMLVESGVMPGLDQEVEDAGGLPDYEAELEAARETAAAIAANANQPEPPPQRQAANDAAPKTLYVSRKVLNAEAIITWAKGQGFETTLPAGDLHVTVAFSREPVDWIKVGTSWSEDDKGRLTVRPGGPRMMERFGEAVVLLFSSTDLQWRHQDIRNAGASWDHEEYQPHITITYSLPDGFDLDKVQPYRGEIVLGPEIFEEVNEDWRAKIEEQ